MRPTQGRDPGTARVAGQLAPAAMALRAAHLSVCSRTYNELCTGLQTGSRRSGLEGPTPARMARGGAAKDSARVVALRPQASIITCPNPECAPLAAQSSASSSVPPPAPPPVAQSGTSSDTSSMYCASASSLLFPFCPPQAPLPRARRVQAGLQSVGQASWVLASLLACLPPSYLGGRGSYFSRWMMRLQ